MKMLPAFIGPAKDMNEVRKIQMKKQFPVRNSSFFEKNGPFVHPPPSICS
jgi:hypothetical protein